MAEEKKAKEKAAEQPKEAGAGEVQEYFDEATDKGYFGENAADRGGVPNEEFSLESGPDGPTANEQLAGYYQQLADQRTNPNAR